MWVSEKAATCEVCHTREEEWETKDENGKVRPINAYLPYVTVCPGCKATGEAYEAVSKSAGKNHSTHGAKVRLITPEQKKAMIESDALARMKAKEDRGLASEPSGGIPGDLSGT